MAIKKIFFKYQKILVIFIFFEMFFSAPNSSFALPNSTLSYQGRLTDTSGNVVANGTYSIRFAIYDTESDSSSLWTETKTVAVTNGIFSTTLGDNTSLTLNFNDATYYLGIKVGSDAEMTPRRQIGAAPFAINCKRLDGKPAGRGANDILTLDEYGNIDINGQIKTTNDMTAGTTTLDKLTVKTDFTLQSGTLTLPAKSIIGDFLADETIVDGKINASANINPSKIFGTALTLTGGTMAGNIAMGNNDLTGLKAITFTDTSGTIAGIQNQNLVDKTDTETIGGAWIFNNNVTINSGFSIGIGAAAGHISFTDAATDLVTVANGLLVVNDGIKGYNGWSGSVGSGAWGGLTKAVALATIAASDLVIITPASQQIGTKYWVTITPGVGFTLNSDNGGETMGFSWVVIKHD